MAFHCNHIIMCEFFCVFFSHSLLQFNTLVFLWFSFSWKWIGASGSVLLQTNRIQSVLIHCSITVHGCLCVWCTNSKYFFIHISVSLFIWIALFCSHSEFSLNWHTFIYLFIGDHVRIYVCVLWQRQQNQNMFFCSYMCGYCWMHRDIPNNAVVSTRCWTIKLLWIEHSCTQCNCPYKNFDMWKIKIILNAKSTETFFNLLLVFSENLI